MSAEAVAIVGALIAALTSGVVGVGVVLAQTRERLARLEALVADDDGRTDEPYESYQRSTSTRKQQ
jgi:hypothetical protein